MIFGISLALLIFYIVIIVLHFTSSIKLTSTPMIISVFSSFSVFSCLLMPLMEESFVEGALLAMLIITVAAPIIVYQIRSCGKNAVSPYESLRSVRDILIGGTFCNGIMILFSTIVLIILLLSNDYKIADIFPGNLSNLIALPFFLLADLLRYDDGMAIGAGICFGLVLNLINIVLIFTSAKTLYAPSFTRNLCRFIAFIPFLNFCVIIAFLAKTARLSKIQKPQNI